MATKKITKFAQRALTQKKHELEKSLLESKDASSINISVWKSNLSEVNDFLDNSSLIEFNEETPVSVEIGTHIKVENLRTNDIREYTVMTRVTADPLNGTISNESPLAQRMLGLKLGNTFKFQDSVGQLDTFKVKSIE
jgi:transcription elongation factor GreA